jgi:murein DD-endopeptidase MepM/ murein hydrolase activator NlpD
MALPTLPGDEKREEKLNPGQKHYDQSFNDIAQAEEQGTFDGIANNYDQTADSSQEDGNIKKLKEQESEGDSVAAGGWKNTTGTTDKNSKANKTKKVFAFAKKRGGIIGLIAIFGVSGGILASFFGPASMLINLAENATLKNDSSSTALERRFLKVFGFSTAVSDPVCANNTKNLKCKMGRISNTALNQLERKGITPYFDNDTDTNNRKKLGYPTKNPSGYTIDLKDGNAPRNIAAKDLTGFLANNPKVAAKVLGTGGAFNVRLKAWSGKHITEKLYNKFGLKRDGGLADGSSKKMTPIERLADASKKLQEKIPGNEKLSGVAENVKGKITSRIGAANKGGIAYVSAVAGCIAVKAPGIIATGVAGVQLAQVMPAGMDVVLSPGAKAKASGVDTANSITADDADTIGTLVTNKTARESDGKMTSALDSPVLQSVIGVNTAKAAVSKNYTPGYAVLTSPLVREAGKADAAAEPACNVIMSPAAMYTAMAVNGAVTIALSATIVGGIASVVLQTGLSVVVGEIASQAAEVAAKTVVTDLAKNDKIEKAEGEALGDVLGVSMASMFSAGGMARHLPVLKESDVAGFETARLESEAFQREMDIASLSPFDTSSKYTFLGSIVNNAQFAVLQSGSYNGNILSALPGLMNFSRSAFSTDTNAADFTNNYCSYAEQFGLGTDNKANDPAINIAGLPCTGLTPTQTSMGTAEAIDLVRGEGWLDESKPISDTDSLQDLLKSGYIVADTPLADNMNSCSNAETGDYLLNSPGCTVPAVGAGGTSADIPALKNPRSLEAMAVFLLDYQQVQMLNGDDIVTDKASAPAATSGKFVLPTDPGYRVSYGWGPRSCPGCSSYHKGVDITDFPGGSSGKPVYAVADGEVLSANKANGINGGCTGNGKGSNNIVKVKHANGIISSYWHMSANNISVNAGDKVTAGQPIGKVGNCGQSYGAHLHFEIEIGDATDPGLLGVTGPNASGVNRNPAAMLSLLGVDIISGTYTDGR